MKYKKSIVNLILPLTFTSCITYNKISQEINEICPGVESNSKIELKKIDNEYNESSKLIIKNNIILYNDKNSNIEFIPELKKISYNNQNYNKKNKEYNLKIDQLIEKISYFEDNNWINFNLEKVIECIEKSKE